MNESFEGMKRELDLRIGDAAEQINSMTHEIAGLNDTIAQCESRGEIPNDLYDRRDMMVRNLSSKLDVTVTPDQRGQITIISGGSVLVQGNDCCSLTVARTPDSEGKTAGQVDVFVKNAGGGERPITRLITGGELGGMIRVRDAVIGEAQGQLDKIAHHVAGAVNGVHTQGTGLDGTSGKKLFNDVGDVKGAAFRFGISDEVGKNYEGIAVGSSLASGDNTIALKIADLQNEKGLASTNVADQSHTINESLNALVGKIGVETQRDDSFFQHQQAVVDQLNNYQQSISGVSLEEEAVNMIQYQTVFNASAKAMKVGEELFNTILSLKD
jgi:flagellar hook-associated protein 1 FlgK